MTKIDEARVLVAIRDAEAASGTRVAVHVAHHHVGDAFEHAQKAFHGKGMHHVDNGNAVLFTVAPKSRKVAVYGGRAVHERLGEPFWNALIAEMTPLFAGSSDRRARARHRAPFECAAGEARVIAALLFAAAVTLPARPASFATDTTHTLRAETVQSLNGELQSYYTATGNTILVWVGNSTGDTPLEEWTIAAASKWKVGQAKKDDGAILFVFMQDHKARIEVGYGLEGSLTDAAASRIIRDTIVPKMRSGDPDGAITAGVDAMLVAATPSYAQKIGRPVAAATSQPDETDDKAAIVFILIIFIIALGVISIALRRGKGSWIMASPLFWGGSGGSGFSGGSFGGGGFSGGFGGGFGGGGASGGW